MRGETQSTHNEIHYCFIEYLEILKGTFGNTYSDERVTPCVCFVVILWILHHVNTAPRRFLGWPLKYFPFWLICLLFLVSIRWIQKQFTTSKTVKVIPPWMPTHLSCLSKLLLFYPFVLFSFQRDKRVIVCADEAVFCPLSFPSYYLHA